MRKILILFGILDLISMLKSYRFWMDINTNFEINWINSLMIVFYISLIFSSIFLLKYNLKGLILNYIQFPIRISLFVMSFGFLVPLSGLFDNYGTGIQILSIICFTLEITRLIVSIYIHRKVKKGDLKI